MSEVSGVDLEPYFRTWMFEAWKLDHAIASVEASDQGTVVKIEDRGRAQVHGVVEATFEDGSKKREVIATAHWKDHVTATVKFEGKAVAVVLDPDVTTIDVARKNNEWKAKKSEGDEKGR
jgi:hypothetical protein